ncbi:MAG TPA: DEAD/DEAH box helicase [Candidatus Acidoferrales bacterium]|nr:DEAD/DEAH box helicase [Candidatus Acidoferrales bacterium]
MLNGTTFHPLVARWFAERFGEPTAPQVEGWRHIAAGSDTLIAAPTGSGKTLAAFLWAINRLIEAATNGHVKDRTSVVYVSPLKALANDIQKNLQQPLAEIQQLAADSGVALPEIRVMVRSGDTPAHERQMMVRRPPHILITTPESFYILLTAERSRQMLKSAETVIVDEIHAVAGDKRGAHLVLSLERLDALAGRRLQRIGLSATQNPITEIARLLVGTERVILNGPPDCAIVDVGHKRALDLSIEVTGHELGPIATHELYADIYDRIVGHVKTQRTTIVFVNTRRLVERVAHQLEERLGKGKVAAHHGSLSRKIRLEAEEGLKSGAVPVVVATASLELGIDVGHVDLVCHLGSPRALATLLQRVGRSGHWLGAVPKGILFPLTRDDLVQCAAAIRAVRAGQLDRVTIPENPLDVLAQQLVATVAGGELSEDEAWQLVHRAYPFRNLRRDDFEAVLEMLSEGVATRRGRRSAHLHRDRVHRTLRPRRGARLAAITSGGAIPDTADYDVIEEPAGTFVGKVNEDFAVESMAGDIFLLGNRSWRIRRVEMGKIRVDDAHGAPPTIPFWLGEAPARTAELSAAVAALRAEVAARLDVSGQDHGIPPAPGETVDLREQSLDTAPEKMGPTRDERKGNCEIQVPPLTPSSRPLLAAYRGTSFSPLSTRPSPGTGEVDPVTWLMAECGVDQPGAEQIVTYIAETRTALGTLPTQQTIIAERFFDEGGGMQLVVHAPFGGRINRAWGLALRKRFCRTFDFELQAAATDDGIVLSLGEQHSFPLENVFAMVRSATLADDLTQAALAAPMFGTRWRWNATRALALLRHTGGKRVPMPIQRMRAEDLLAAVFPAQLACGDNHPGGPVELPDHPLVNETIDNCLHEAMDLDGLRELIESIERGALQTVAIDTAAPSPMSHEILNANPYAFLDDAPLEERRARAVSLRRVDPDLAGGIGALDPAAIDEVRAQAWPDVRDADELHDFLLSVGVLPTRALTLTLSQRERGSEGFSLLPRPLGEGRGESAVWATLADELIRDRRATQASWGDHSALVAAERISMVTAAVSHVRFNPTLPPLRGSTTPEPEDAVRAIVQGWMECLGPVTSAALAAHLGLPETQVEAALLRLESEGIVLRGQFTSSKSEKRKAESGKPERASDFELSAFRCELPIEWCERRLLARIHRLTITRLRKEIEAVSAADFIRFLLRWQHVQPGTQLHGRDGVLQVIGQLQGLELPAPAWERDVLPGRINLYNGGDLEHLCLAGEVAWGRLRLAAPAAADEDDGITPVRGRRRTAPNRAAPLAFVLRESLAALLEPAPLQLDVREDLSTAARDVFAHLEHHGASFLTDMARVIGRLPGQTEEALWELVARGLVTGDGIAGLRTLLLPDVKRRQPRHRLRALRGGAGRRLMPVGRWSVLRTASTQLRTDDAPDEMFARQLLRRYGIVLRELLAREVRAPAWRVLLQIYRRMEARGEIRGGRFVAGFVGEQFALPEAVDTLRAVRRAPDDAEPVIVAATDPLNLVGILTPGARVSPFSNQVIAYHHGVPVEVGELGAVLSRVRRGSMSVQKSPS